MRSADAIVTKAGYGIITEAAANGTRILYAERENWCETPILESWIESHCVARKVSREKLSSGRFTGELMQLLARPSRPPATTNGAGQAVEAIMQLI